MGAKDHKVGSPINVWQSLSNVFINQASNLKVYWDQVGEIVRAKHDALCDYIDTYIATKQDIISVTLGQILDGTITTEKLDPNALQANVTKLSTNAQDLYGVSNVDDALKGMYSQKKNVVIIDTSGTWTPPRADMLIDVFMIGGGGGGGAGGTSGGGGGGSGRARTVLNFPIKSLTPKSVVIGAGGTSGTNGGNTSFDGIISLYGASASAGSGSIGGTGGTGGGGGGSGYNGGIAGNGGAGASGDCGGGNATAYNAGAGGGAIPYELNGGFCILNGTRFGGGGGGGGLIGGAGALGGGAGASGSSIGGSASAYGSGGGGGAGSGIGGAGFKGCVIIAYN